MIRSVGKGWSIILVSFVMTGGCRSWTWWPASSRGWTSPHEAARVPGLDAPGSGQTGPASDPKHTIEVVDLAFNVLRAELAFGPIHHSRKIWNHVDELRVDTDLVARLARNGLRVGAAAVDSWPALRAVFEAAESKVSGDQFVAQRGWPLLIELGEVQGNEPVFTYGPDTRLVGKTFTAGKKLISIDYVFHPELGGYTDIRLALQIRHDKGAMTWQRTNGVIRQTPDYDSHVFLDLEVPLTLRTGEFLVIGPSDEAGIEYLVGSRFLTKVVGGKRYETLLCITPEPFRTSHSVRSPS